MNLRPELEALPERMKELPIDRGYPVPWFVDWVERDGVKVPEFRAMDPNKFVQAITLKLCWVCGQRLGSYLGFLIGPMCGVNRVSSEPPSHVECAKWSARNCPFLSRPHMERREMGKEYPDVVPGAGVPILRNPGVSLVWVTRDYKVFKDGKGGYLLNIGHPIGLSFWAEGRHATRAEIDESVRTGLPLLEEQCQNSSDKAALRRMTAEFQLLLPAA